MDYQRFALELPTQYHHWGNKSICPASDAFQTVLAQVEGMTTTNVAQLLNFAVSCLEPGEVYCEVGCYQGATLIGALLHHPDCMAYAVDNFSEFDPLGKNQERLLQNLTQFGLEDQVCFCEQDFEAFFGDLRAMQLSDRIGVYFYDGAHDYRSQMMGLFLVRPFLAERALIIVNHSNWGGVQQANWDFIAAHPECDLLLDLPTPMNGHPTFWNGIQVLSWDVATHHSYDGSTLGQNRQSQFLDAMSRLSADSVQPQLTAPEPYETAASDHYAQGLAYEQQGQITLAAQAYQQAIALDATLLDGYVRLGHLVAEHGDPHQAALIYQQVIAHDPQTPDHYVNLGQILLVQKEIEPAIAAFETALQLNPGDPSTHQSLEFAHQLLQDEAQACIFAGNRMMERQRYADAAIHYQRLLELQLEPDSSAYSALAECYEQMRQYEAAIEICQRGLEQASTPTLHRSLIRALRETNQTAAAIAQATVAAHQFPTDLYFKLQQHLLLPLLYETTEAIQQHRTRFIQGLATLLQEINLPAGEDALPQSATVALAPLQAAIAQHTNFLLAYQNANDVELQKQYGEFVHQVIAAIYPEFNQPLPLPPVTDKIRIGYVSGCMWEHTVGKLMIGWLRHHNREQFEIYSYALTDKQDGLNQQYRDYSDAFYQPSEMDLRSLGEQIRSDQLHILVFFDLGLQPLMTQLAALRLASVQCATWAHPVTSGLPTVDYFLSSDLMEPENAQEHYSEKLIRLPKIGISFAPSEIPALTKSRSEFGLQDDAVVYLTSQLLCKYLPQQDRVLAAIAQQVPQAQFVFVARPNATVAHQFQQRLKTAFAAVGLDSDRHCVMLPPLNQADYWNLNQIANIFLDSFGWSGGHTTLEAIACRLPVVTCPGEFMRGRHSYAILTLLGMTDTIAQTESDYVDIAVRLGQDATWRTCVIEQMAHRSSYLFNDTTCVTALESFYQTVVQDGMI